MKTIHVLLIRHCETEENVKTRHLNETLQSLRRRRLPTWEQVSNALLMAAYDANSKVTDLGRRQIADMSMTLQEVGFWKSFAFDRCAYSPLDRTKDTCLGIVPPAFHDKCQPLDLLREIELYENLLPSRLQARIHRVQQWLIDQHQHQNGDTVVLVGHSRFFHKMVGGPAYMWNCDVCQSAFVYDPLTRVGNWNTPVLLFRSPLALAHPVDSIFAALGLQPTVPAVGHAAHHDDDEHDSDTAREHRRKEREAQRHANFRKRREEASALGDTSYEEPSCRICQAKQSEMPDLKMLRPCKCNGTLEWVHLDCLNQWRATSPLAYTTCSVCQCPYRVRKSKLTEWIMHPTVLLIVAIVLTVTITFLVGIGTTLLLDRWFPQYSSTVITDYLGLHISLPPAVCRIRSKRIDNTIHRILRSSFSRDFDQWTLNLWTFLACTPIVSFTIRALIVGVLMMALIAHVNQYYTLLFRRNGAMFGEPNRLPGLLGVTSIWICGDLRYSIRLTAVFGMALVGSRLHGDLCTKARKYAHDYLGSVVLDREDED
eukprot:gene8409-6071_t